MVIRTWHKGPCLVFSVAARPSLLTTMCPSSLISFHSTTVLSTLGQALCYRLQSIKQSPTLVRTDAKYNHCGNNFLRLSFYSFSNRG